MITSYTTNATLKRNILNMYGVYMLRYSATFAAAVMCAILYYVIPISYMSTVYVLSFSLFSFVYVCVCVSHPCYQTTIFWPLQWKKKCVHLHTYTILISLTKKKFGVLVPFNTIAVGVKGQAFDFLSFYNRNIDMETSFMSFIHNTHT